MIQPKLTINTPGDEYEQEADRISERVMRTPEPQLQPVAANKHHYLQTEPHAHQHVRTKRVEPATGEKTPVPAVIQEILS